MCEKWKTTVAVTVLILCFSLLSFAGGQQEPSPATAETSESDAIKAVNLTFVHGGSGGGTWGLTAEGIAEAIRRTAPGSVITTVPGSSKGNIVRMGDNEADMGFTFLNNLIDATQGREGFEKTDVKVIGSPISSVAHLICLKSLGIESIQELKENKTPIRLSVHQRGSGNEQYTRRMLQEYGIVYEDIESWGGKIVHANQGDSLQLIADGQLDAFSGGGEPPKAQFIDLNRKRPLTSLRMDEGVIASMGAKYGYTPTVIKAGTYEFLDEDYPTFAASVVIAVRGDMPDDTAYLLAKAMYEHREYLGTVHSNVKTHIVDDPDGLIAGIPEIAPVHPGALKYYREAGLVK